jgi:YidC/Oxa1 family membrane protein insertase
MVVVQMDDQNKNLILATALSFLVILGWFVGGPMLFPQWFPEETAAQQATVPEASVPAAAESQPTATAPAAEPTPEAPRLTIDTPKLSGTLSLAGGRIDDLSLKTYRETIDQTSPEVRLLSPWQGPPLLRRFGWLAATGWNRGCAGCQDAVVRRGQPR